MTKVYPAQFTRVFVSGLPSSTGSQELVDIFSTCGEVTGVQLGEYGSCQIDFRSEEDAVRAEKAELDLGGFKLIVSRVGNLAGDLPVPSFQSVYPGGDIYQYPLPIYYPQSAPPSPYPQFVSPVQFPPPVTPVQYQVQATPVQFPPPATSIQFPPPAPVQFPPPLTPVSDTPTSNVFTFDSDQTTDAVTSVPPTPKFEGGSSCHVCSTRQLPIYPHQIQGQPPLVYYVGQSGHQLQPLTPITPSTNPYYLSNSYFPPPPTCSQPVTPGYYGPRYQLTTNDNQQLYPPQIPPSVQFSSSEPCKPDFTRLKKSDGLKEQGNRNPVVEGGSKEVKGGVSYFTSPFKSFSKFNGTPTPTRFPLQRSGSGGRGRKDDGDKKGGLYQAGARWGRRDSGTEWPGWENKKTIEKVPEPELDKKTIEKVPEQELVKDLECSEIEMEDVKA